MPDNEKRFDFQPMRMHKNLVIDVLRNHPEDVGKIFTDGRYTTAAEAIAALEAHPGIWIVDGVLSEDNGGDK